MLGVFFLSCSHNNQKKIALDNELNKLLITKDYFNLKNRLEKSEGNLSKDRFLYYQAHCLDVFNNSELSQESINLLLNEYKNRLNDTIMADLLEIQSRNYGRMFQYKKVIEVSHKLLDEYPHLIDSAKTKHYKENIELYGKVADLEPTIIHKEGNVEIKSSRNPFMNLVTVPVSCGGISKDFLFDTGATMSCISMSKAKQMGMTIYETDISVETSSFEVKANLAVADSLYVGDILFERVLLLVVPIMNIPELDFLISGIIGVPEMRLMEEVHIKKDGSIFIPKAVQEFTSQNMFYEGLSGVYPIVRLNSGTDTLNMALDYGATQSYLSQKYLKEHQQEIEKKCEPKEISNYGLGGERKFRSYRIRDFAYEIGNKESVLSVMSVKDCSVFKDKFDGLIGQDIFLPFEQININFKNMHLEIE
jgi:predicted aspartyl protease